MSLVKIQWMTYPASFDDIIDEHMEDILDDFKDAKCKKHIDKDLKKWIRNVDFEK